MTVKKGKYFTTLIAEDGMVLTDGNIYSKEVFLGKNDSVDNWKEVEPPVEDTDEMTDIASNDAEE